MRNQYEIKLLQRDNDKPLIIKECDGDRDLISYKIFEASTEKDFLGLCPDISNVPTKLTEVNKYFLGFNIYHSDIINHFKQDLSDLCFTQHQILSFLVFNNHELGLSNFFFLKKNNEYFFVDICKYNFIGFGLKYSLIPVSDTNYTECKDGNYLFTRKI